jgi:hypothetical protein
MKKSFIRLAWIAGCGLMAAGCITHETTTVRNVERAKVEFENDKAARIFYEALNRSQSGGARSESTTRVRVPVVFDHRKRVTTGPNSAFNEAVAACDANRDGRITEIEANIYASQVEK